MDEEQVVAPVEALQNAITDPGAQDAIGDALTHINNHLQQAAIADANTAAGDNFINDWQRFGGGLTQWVAQDPTAVHAAMDAVVPVARGFASVGDDPAHADTLTSDLQRQLAIAAVKGAADQHAGVAADLLGNDRIKTALGDDTHRQLIQYTYAQADARQRDESSQQIERAQDAADQSRQRFVGYAGGLLDPTSNSPRFPDRWNQSVLSDPAVRPEHQGMLGDLYATLRQRGDAPATDGLTAAALVNAVASGTTSPEEIMGHAVAGNLRYQDAVHLARLSLDDHAGADDHAQGLAQLTYAGRTAIMGRDGENGAAGVNAFDRYMNWLLPNYRRTGVAGSVPESEGYLLPNGLAAFMPSGDDLPKGPPPEPSPEQNFSKNQPYVKEGATSFNTDLGDQETAFRKWVKDNNVPFDPDEGGPQDYDMRGFYKGLTTGDPHAETGINQNDHQLHFSDYWKTPYHKSFSAESQWANPKTAPHWNDKDQLVTPDGRVVFDERAPVRRPLGEIFNGR